MKNINCKISNEAYKVLSDYKLDKNLKKLEEALNNLLLSMKGGKTK